jgi:hypothetical protein
MAVTDISDIVVPSIFVPYVQQMTMVRSALVQSGAAVRDPTLDGFLAGGGITFNLPSWQDLSDAADNVGTADATASTPDDVLSSNEIAVRLSRNASWSAYDLAAALAGDDPMRVVADRVAAYWTRRLQDAFVATMKGVFADNAAAPSGSEHVANDMTVDIKGGAYSAGVTDFSAEAFIDAALTMGDAMGELTLAVMHSVVYARAQKNNLIDFIPDSNGVVNIPTFLGRRVIVDDSMPVSTGVYETWLFGQGAVRLGQGAPKVPVEIDRDPEQGTGAGQETLYSRTEWIIHPVGHKYAGTAPNGGPGNGTGANALANAGSWMRVYPERKQIKIARLITREA